MEWLQLSVAPVVRLWRSSCVCSERRRNGEIMLRAKRGNEHMKEGEKEGNWVSNVHSNILC